MLLLAARACRVILSWCQTKSAGTHAKCGSVRICKSGALTRVNLEKASRNVDRVIYKHSDLEQIATAIRVDVNQVVMRAAEFQAAARWFWLDQERPKRAAPSRQIEKLNQAAKSAHRFLKSLGINDLDEAADGPGDRDIFRALVMTGDSTKIV